MELRTIDFFCSSVFNNIGTNMKNCNKISQALKPFKSCTKRETYSFGFGDKTKGYGLSIRNGRLIERIAKSKIFYSLYIQ